MPAAPSGFREVRRSPAAAPAREPLIIAHRGSSAAAPEHTVAAYRRAVAEGADGLECDVRLTSDGHLVCVHDRRVDRTSDGTGVVSRLELADLHELDFASWRPETRSSDAPDEDVDRDTTGSGVLTLEALLALAASSGHRTPVYIETKHPTRYAGLVEQRLVEVLADHDLIQPAPGSDPAATVMSFSPTSLRRIRLLAPALPTVLLMGPRRPPGRRNALLPPGVRIAGPGIEVLRAWPDYVRRAHARGHRVHGWTVDSPADLEYVLALGVDAVITNRPAQALRRLGR